MDETTAGIPILFLTTDHCCCTKFFTLLCFSLLSFFFLLGGMEPNTVAEKILVSIARKETDIVLADAKTTAAVQMKATLPDVVSWIMTKRARS